MQTIIFDLDGTLADSLADITAALGHVLAAAGLPAHPTTRTRAWVGWGVRHLVEHAAPAGADVDALVRAFRARYAANLVVDTAPYPGVGALLDTLVAGGATLAVLSNKPHDMTCRIVDQVFARWRFADVRGHRPPTPRKPDPTAALDIAAGLGVAPGDVVFVGDTSVDIDTARAAGMTPVAVSWGFRPARELAGAAVIVDTPAQLGAWLGERR